MQSRCPNPSCASTDAFEVIAHRSATSAREIDLVRCTGCGTVVGVSDYRAMEAEFVLAIRSLRTEIDALQKLVQKDVG